MYLLDTNVVSELRKVRAGKADPGVAAWADRMDAGDLFVSVMTIQELEIGVLLMERRDPAQGHVRPRAMSCGPGLKAMCYRHSPGASCR